MKRYLLDTNIVSYLVQGHSRVQARIQEVPLAALSISAITQAELLFGLAKRPDAKRLHKAVHEFLRAVEIMPWDDSTAPTYGLIRAKLQSHGKTLDTLDLLIAAHASALKRVLVTRDAAFMQVADLLSLEIEDWTLP